MTELLHKELTGAIIGAYYKVYNHTSRTYREHIYESALMEELRRRGLSATRQDEYQIIYKERLVGKQRLDLFVVQEIVVENKAMVFPVAIRDVRGVHLDNLKDWMRICGVQLGILANFNALHLDVVFVRA
jgi:GxxExxY protein